MNTLDLAVYDEIRGALTQFPAIKYEYAPTPQCMFEALSHMYSPGIPEEVRVRNTWRKKVKKLRAEFTETRFKFESNIRHIIDTTDLINKTIVLLNELEILFNQVHINTDGLLRSRTQYESHHY